MSGSGDVATQMPGPVFSTGVEVAIAAVTAFGILANGVSAYNIGNTFPYRKVAIFFLVLMDSTICCVGSSLYLAMFVVAGYYRNLTICTLQFSIRIFQIYTGTMIILEIAITR